MTDTLNGSATKLAKTTLVAAILALLGSGTVMLRPDARADSFTGTQATKMEKRLTTHIDEKVDAVVDSEDRRWRTHVATPHVGVVERLATMEAHYRDLKEDIAELKDMIRELRKER